jgi:endo-1,3-1,4-beta-glycanase ExoK
MNTLRIVVMFLAVSGAAAQTHRTPTFQEHFNTGVLNTSVWIVSNWAAPGGGVFRPDNIDLSQGLLGISLTQTKNSDGSISSVGGELQTKAAYGYGTYEWIMRMSSTSPTKDGYGQVTSGQVSSGFSFINNSQTEIDYEVEGQFPNQIEMTNWTGINAQQYSSSFLQSPEDGFHKYKFVWSASKIVFYIDGVQVSTHTMNIPSAPAYVMINHWGTNSTSFGGLATPGVERYMYVSSFKFWAQ